LRGKHKKPRLHLRAGDNAAADKLKAFIEDHRFWTRLSAAELALLALGASLIVVNGPDPFSCPLIGPLLSCHFDHDAIAETGDAGDRYELR
jgi:hypothetical protein